MGETLSVSSALVGAESITTGGGGAGGGTARDTAFLSCFAISAHSASSSKL